jgi:hypothetical protein
MLMFALYVYKNLNNIISCILFIYTNFNFSDVINIGVFFYFYVFTWLACMYESWLPWIVWTIQNALGCQLFSIIDSFVLTIYFFIFFHYILDHLTWFPILFLTYPFYMNRSLSLLLFFNLFVRIGERERERENHMLF